MSFSFALSRMIILSFIIATDATWLVLSAIALHEKTGGAIQICAICFGVLSLLTIVGCLCHQLASQDEEVSNMRNMAMFGFCGLLGFGMALAISLTAHARQDRGVDLCTDFASTRNPCVTAGVQLGMAYVSLIFALIGFIISWIDKFPGAVKVTPRYPITKAPSSYFTAYAYDLDGNYTHPPVKMSSRPRNSSKWTDVPINY